MHDNKEFNELVFFAEVKKRPGMYFGKPSLLSLRDCLVGMEYVFRFQNDKTPLCCFRAFVNWYTNEIINHESAYACWWNHILYTCGNNDCDAFEEFFVLFERYLHDVQKLSLPEIE